MCHLRRERPATFHIYWAALAPCLLPTAYCLLPTAYCLLPTAYYNVPAPIGLANQPLEF